MLVCAFKYDGSCSFPFVRWLCALSTSCLVQSYIPSDTPFLDFCRQSFSLPPSHCIRGIDMLLAQGFEGFDLWLDALVPGKRLSVECWRRMEKAVREQYEQTQKILAAKPLVRK